MPDTKNPTFRLRLGKTYTDLNADERLPIVYGPHQVNLTADQAADLVRLLLDAPKVREALGDDLKTYL